jgi:hypothetical protein
MIPKLYCTMTSFKKNSPENMIANALISPFQESVQLVTLPFRLPRKFAGRVGLSALR